MSTLSVDAKTLAETRTKQPPVKLNPAKAARTVERLSMPESYALVEFLKTLTLTPGMTYESLAVAARQSLNNEKINKNHVQQRCEEFSITLPKRVPMTPAGERIAALEAALDLVIKDNLRMANLMKSGHIGYGPTAELSALAQERGLI